MSIPHPPVVPHLTVMPLVQICHVHAARHAFLAIHQRPRHEDCMADRDVLSPCGGACQHASAAGVDGDEVGDAARHFGQTGERRADAPYRNVGASDVCGGDGELFLEQGRRRCSRRDGTLP